MRVTAATSLQSRLTLLLGVVLVAVFGAHVWLMNYFPRYLVEENVIERLRHDAESLKNRLLVEPGQAPALSPGPISPIYSTPKSGHYFQATQNHRILLSPSLEGHTLELPALGADKTAMVMHLKGPFGQPLLIWNSIIDIAGQPVRLAVAEAITDVEQDIADLQKIYLIGIATTVLLLILAQRLIIRRTLRPVEQARADLRDIELGRATRIRQQQPSEIQPLVDEINMLLDSMQKRLQRSRNATGNLAHALKTPLSVISQLTEEEELRKHPELAGEIEQATEAMRRAIERELKRARVAGAVATPEQYFSPKEELPELVAIMRKVYAAKSPEIGLNIHTGAHFQADREDMLELLGNLLDNACKWCEKRVKIDIRESNGLSIKIQDDGPGIDKENQQNLALRGVRLDEKTPGHGLGLSIVREIIDEYEGNIEFSRSAQLSGLCVELRLPVNALHGD